jgi:cobalt-zinc-cadmium efflux system membrane fusion protein
MKNIFICCFSFLAAFVLLLAGCKSDGFDPIEIGNNTPSAQADAELIEVSDSQFALGNMKLGQISDYTFSSRIRATGMIEVPVKNHIRVSAYAGGYVKNIDLIPGQKIRRGQTLFTLENPEFVQMQQEYLETRAQLNYLQSDYERQKTLAEENIASQKSFLKAESDYRVAQTKMEGLKKRLLLLGIQADELTPENLLSRISVHAPASGYVTGVNAMKGMFLNPRDVAIEMIDIDHLHVELNVFEKDILKVKEGQKIQFSIPEASEETFAARVKLVGKTVEGSNRVIWVHGHLEDNPNAPEFIPGMFIEADIITEAQSSPGLPESAVVEANDKAFILMSKGRQAGIYQFEKIEIQTGLRENGMVQVLNGEDFREEQKILVVGAFNLITED